MRTEMMKHCIEQMLAGKKVAFYSLNGRAASQAYYDIGEMCDDSVNPDYITYSDSARKIMVGNGGSITFMDHENELRSKQFDTAILDETQLELELVGGRDGKAKRG